VYVKCGIVEKVLILRPRGTIPRRTFCLLGILTRGRVWLVLVCGSVLV
jgi:hypothetical protein